MHVNAVHGMHDSPSLKTVEDGSRVLHSYSTQYQATGLFLKVGLQGGLRHEMCTE